VADVPSSGPAVLDVPVLVRLLDGFGLDIGHREVTLPVHAQRVLAFLALSRPVGMPQRRTVLAETLWCGGSHERAQASLRTSIWRIRQAGAKLVHADRWRVRLDAQVEVDVERSLGQAGRLLARSAELAPEDTVTGGLTADLLPGWDDDWLVVERERIHLVRIQALVALSHRLCLLGRFLPALDAAYTAIAAEPLHESAHAALVDVQLAEGNVVQARQHVDRYSQLLWDEMRLRPSESLVSRVQAR
jgi:DNA-binding SARP family transcriptional activator